MFERIGLYVKAHSSELAVYGIMTAISLAIAVAISGDISEALARRGRH